ncbi:MAG: aminoacyl-tRNA deacylase [Ignavibacteriales bacterium]|nr:aminoacyl-tRNA deacylase [Ignavibacteriales bacterium]
MKKSDIRSTSAVRFLREKGIHFVPHFYSYEEHGGTRVASDALGISEHITIKTIIMKTNEKQPIIVLMHGDCEVSTKNLARFLGVKNIEPCDARTAERLTGYIFGGMSPFGTRTSLPVYVERSIYSLDRIFINGGKRGFLVEMRPSDLRILSPTEISVAIPIQ